MSEVGERKALDRPTLLDHATSLHRMHPDGPLPNGGRPNPDVEDAATFPRTGGAYRERKRRLVELVTAVYNAEPSPAEAAQRLAEALASERIDQRVAAPLPEAIAFFDPRWRRCVGRELAYSGRDRGKVMVGLALLAGVAEPDDAGPVRLLGLLGRHFGEMAIRILRGIPGAAGDLVWLSERSDPLRHAQAVEALCALGEPATFDWLLQRGIRLDGPSITNARRVAETVGLADRLATDDPGEDVVEQLGRVLLAMTQRGAGNAELRKYADAQTAIIRFTRAAPIMTPTLDRYALTVGLLADLATGQAATLRWPDHDLDRVTRTLDDLLVSQPWEDLLHTALRSADPKIHHRAHWAAWTRTTNRRPPPMGHPMDDATSRISIRISVADPQYAGAVETRIFVDDRPVVLEAFDAGPAEPPEYLLGFDHRLHADAEPHEVRLAEADCTEGCCGALYVTIQRSGDEVVWRDWRNPDNSGLRLPTFTFDAAQYDAEIARAEADHSWEWHERTVARLVRTRLREQPELLTRWGCHAGWMEARPNDRGRVHVSYLYPRRPTSSDEPWLQFVAVLDVPEGEPEAVADNIIRELCDGDPRRQDRLTGGSREAAEQYGFQSPPSR